MNALCVPQALIFQHVVRISPHGRARRARDATNAWADGSAPWPPLEVVEEAEVASWVARVFAPDLLGEEPG